VKKWQSVLSNMPALLILISKIPGSNLELEIRYTD
jgi:hypothetical protein